MATDERVSIAKLDVENYAAWSREIKYLLIGRGLWGAVDPGCLDDPEDTAAVAKLDRKAKAFIGLYVLPHHHVTVEAAESAKELWETLEHTYKPRAHAGTSLPQGADQS